MAQLVRGKRSVEISDFRDDHIIVDGEPRDPTSVILTDEEVERLRTDQTAQFLFARYYLDGNRLRRRKNESTRQL